MVLKSDVEKDVEILMASLKKDYQIPTSWEIILPVIKAMLVVYVMHFIAIISALIVYNKNIWFPGVIMWMILSCGLLTIVALIMAYSNLSMLMCIPKEVRDKSLLFRVAQKKFKVYWFVIVVINMIIAVVLISLRGDFIVGYGFSWFACMLIGSFIFSMSMSRYMTPAVVATLDKIRQVVSSGEPMSAKQINDQQP